MFSVPYKKHHPKHILNIRHGFSSSAINVPKSRNLTFFQHSTARLFSTILKLFYQSSSYHTPSPILQCPPLPHPSIQRKNFPVHLSIIPYKQYKIKPPHVLHRIQDKINLIKNRLYSILFINIRKIAHGNKPRKYNHIKNINSIKGNHTPTTSWKGDFQK